MNIFGGTKYELPEEDRVTNALLATIEKTSATFLGSILKKIGSPVRPYIVSVRPQAAYSTEGSRPDGRVELLDHVILLECKRFDTFDRAQLQRHVAGIERNEDKTCTLLCIGEAPVAPVAVRAIRAKRTRVAYISWHEINGVLGALHRRSGDEPSRLVWRELSRFLDQEGYAVYEHRPVSKVAHVALGYLAAKQRLDAERENLWRLATSITHALDSYFEAENDWKLRILDDSWMREHGTLFQFMLLHEKVPARLNFEVYIDFERNPGWIGLGRWGDWSHAPASKLATAVRKIQRTGSPWKVDVSEPLAYRELSATETKRLFLEDPLAGNSRLLRDVAYLYAIFRAL
jgi:hypothetical protein